MCCHVVRLICSWRLLSKICWFLLKKKKKKRKRALAGVAQ